MSETQRCAGDEIQRYEALETVEVNGVCLHYAKAGKGRPVVLVHGNAEDHHLFDTEIEQLAEAGYEVYAPDSRGHGANEPMAEYHYEEMAEDIYQFIRAMGLERPALYGHSDGGILALMLEIRHPGTLGVMAVSGTNLSPDGIEPDFIREYTELNEKEPDPLVTLMLTEPHIPDAILKEIRVPTLVLAGEKDLVLEQETRHIAHVIPGARMKILPEESHGSYIIHNRKIARLILDFCSDR